ncbi:DUF2293 domain-containing protein [[Mycobacterium] zoologicum]|uniref:DUF2293 domain-containing protein n=1 Tax=[Mycobacterium] zoologicum TaxID=2872311 RepID=UPI001CD6D7E1
MSRPPDLRVVSALKEWACTSCSGTGDLLFMEDAGPLCLGCADLGHLEFLPSGDAAMTRRAKKANGLSAVVVRWSRSRKRYERQGILAEPEAIEHAVAAGSARSGAGRALEPGAVPLAVVASVRHADTGYDELLMSGVDRKAAREPISGRVDAVLDGWQTPSPRL